jgi:hypothetical protein
MLRESGVIITVLPMKKARKSEITFPSVRGSIQNVGRKSVSVRSYGFKSKRSS